MSLKANKYRLKVTSCEKTENYYRLEYESEEVLLFKKHDLFTVKDSDNNTFIVTIAFLKQGALNVYMSVQYETSIIGDVEIQLLFSPLTSIEGASEVIKHTGNFPACHYDKIIDYQFENDTITLMIFLEYDKQVMKLQLFDVIENKLVDYQKENIMLQLTFWYVGRGIEVEVSAIDGLDGTVICKRVKAELIEN